MIWAHCYAYKVFYRYRETPASRAERSVFLVAKREGAGRGTEWEAEVSEVGFYT